MNITYFEPLQRAWARMVHILFRPFRIDLWLGLGFAAFLAELGRGGGGGGGSSRFSGRSGAEFRGAADHAASKIHDFLHQPWVQASFVLLVGLFIVVLILLLWLRARGQAVLLDGVMRGSGAVVEPWGRTSRQGNSLFLLYLVLTFGLLAMVVPMLWSAFQPTLEGIWRDGVFRMPDVLGLLARFLLAGALAMIFGLVHVITEHFVLPVALRNQESIFDAWGRFGGLLRDQLGHFIAALLLLLVVAIAIGIAVAIVGFSTCCVGFVLLSIPYLGALLLLPATVFLRGFGPEFLAQFGPEWDARVLVPASEAAPPARPAPPGPAV